MNYITTTRQRNHRFTEAFRKAAAAGGPGRPAGALLDEVLNTPVERGFFVGVDHVVVMDRLRREGKLPRMSAERTELWTELFRQFDALRAARPGMSRTAAACAVVSGGTAPRFYIRRSVALSLINRIKRP